MSGTNIPIPQKTTSKGRSFSREMLSALTKIRSILDGDFSGDFIISDTDIFHAVNFSDIGRIDQVDVDYSVFFTAVGVTGSPATNAYVIKNVARLTDRFEINFAAAPGSGSAIKWTWKFFRYV